MNQPELGKRIVELRKERGLTQEELVEKCNINVRTLQRIESGEVMPRSYTVRLIFAALNQGVQASIDVSNGGSLRMDTAESNWLEQTYKYVFDLFNLRINTMRKVTVLSIIILLVAVAVFSIRTDTHAQNTTRVKELIASSNKDFIRWFNDGQFDSLLTIYTDDACLVGKGCGKTFIGNYHRAAADEVIFKSLTTSSVTLSDTLAVEQGEFILAGKSGGEFRGEYLTEWVFRNNRWLIRKDLPTVEPQ